MGKQRIVRDEAIVPVAKRQALQKEVDLNKQTSFLFQPYRALGLVADDVPFSLQKLGTESFLCASVGTAFQVYNCAKLTLSIVSPQVSHPITALAASNDRTFTACGSSIISWKRTKKMRLYTGHNATINHLLVLGPVLLSADEDGVLKTWDLGVKKKPKQSLPFAVPESQSLNLCGDQGDKFTPTVVMHPHTYLNKVLVASEQGAMELWNIRVGKLVYKFKGFGSGIRSVVQSTVVDVVAIGLDDGRVVVHNLRLDKTLMTLKHKEGEAITSLTFRSDANGSSASSTYTAGSSSVLVAGTEQGNLAVWNLDDRQMTSEIQAHQGAVVNVSFLPGEPVMVSSGVDNTLKMWIFDQEDGSARLLKSREGHKLPPSRIRYYGGNTMSTLSSGADGSCCQILSASEDRSLRVFHTARDAQNREISQGHLLKRANKLDVRVEDLKLPPVLDFAASETRARDWSNIISAHKDDPTCYTWKFEDRVIGQRILRPNNRDGATKLDRARAKMNSVELDALPRACCVGLSNCGNFGVVGTSDGSVFRYNMQSGALRAQYPRPSPRGKRQGRKPPPGSVALVAQEHGAFAGGAIQEAVESGLGREHEGPVAGLAMDALNTTIASAGYDGRIKFWAFETGALLDEVVLEAAVSQVVSNMDSGIFAVACDDLVVRVYDIAGRKLLRKFAGHSGRVTDMGFSNDARWLLTASTDTTLRVWDLPTARCIDWLSFDSHVTSLTLSPTGEYLATSHADGVAINLWANRVHFGGAVGDRLARKPVPMGVPESLTESPSGVVDGKDSPSAAPVEDESEEEEDDFPLEPAFSRTIAFSGTSRARWYTLAHLELIKARNKPIEPAEKPKLAPFFIPTVQDVTTKFADPEKPDTSADAAQSAKNDELDALGDLEGAGDWSDEDENENTEEAEPESAIAGSRLMQSGGGLSSRSRTEFLQLLEECNAKVAHHDSNAMEDDSDDESDEEEDEGVHNKSTAVVTAVQRRAATYEPIAKYLQNLSPSGTDYEIETMCLGPEDDDGARLIGMALEWLAAECQAGTNFELAQAFLNRLITVHSETLLARQDLKVQLDMVKEAQNKSWKRLESLLMQNLCLVQHFSKLQT